MVDTVIKGTGNSRSIRSVPNLAALAPTYEKLLELLTGEGLPVDIGRLNPAGVAVQGTALTKGNLLTDETAALYPNLPEDPTPDDVLKQLSTLLKDTVAGGTYTGLSSNPGTMPSSTEVKTEYTDWHNIVTNFRPRIVLLLTESGTLTTSSNYSSGGINTLGGMFFADRPLTRVVKTTTIVGAEVTSTGFRVRNIAGVYKANSGGAIGYKMLCDNAGSLYQWMAFK